MATLLLQEAAAQMAHQRLPYFVCRDKRPTTANTETLSGHCMSVQIANAGGASMAHCSAQVFGVPLSTMTKISALGLLPTAPCQNNVSVNAGDANFKLIPPISS